MDRYKTSDVNTNIKNDNEDDNDTVRSASATIFYLLTPRSPVGVFHRNRSRTVHTLHRGRGRYVLNQADQAAREKSEVRPAIGSFAVGQRNEKGERLQWCVNGGDYKASYLLPEDEDENRDRDRGEIKNVDGTVGQRRSEGLLISETVVPGFEAADHDFLTPEAMEKLLTPEQVQELRWLLRNHEPS